jgi:hypothetical protein
MKFIILAKQVISSYKYNSQDRLITWYKSIFLIRKTWILKYKVWPHGYAWLFQSQNMENNVTAKFAGKNKFISHNYVLHDILYLGPIVCFTYITSL